MYVKAAGIILPALLCAAGAWCQAPEAPAQNSQPLRTKLVQRTVKAVNYQYQKAATQVDFRGTELDPDAKGWASIGSKKGRTDIKARFSNLADPARLGSTYLTYVFWAITPEGHATNLGEIVPGHGDKASLHVTTHLQSFGLIVTAEPYAAVRQPSDAVVLENQILPTTTGAIKPIEAKYELLPRIEYSRTSGQQPPGAGKKVSRGRYDETMEVYQAQNAVQIAAAAGAEQLAPDTYDRAQALLKNAQEMLNRKGDRGAVIATAREAAQTAEDAREVAYQRAQDAVIAAAVTDAERERQRRLQAEAEAATALAQSEADRAMLQQERQQREREQASAVSTSRQQPLTDQQPSGADQQNNSGMAQSSGQQRSGLTEQQRNAGQQPSDLRFEVYQQLGAQSIDVNDTPRGLVVTLPAEDFGGSDGNEIQGAAKDWVAQLASVIQAHPGVIADVTPRGAPIDNDPRARAVRNLLVADGAPADVVRVQTATSGAGSTVSDLNSGQRKGVDICLHGQPIDRQ